MQTQVRQLIVVVAAIFSVVFSARANKCPHELGMESGGISDRQIVSSSNQDPDHDSDKGRLHGPSAWCSARVRDKYIQVDLKKTYRLGAIATQGHPFQDNWVNYYSIAYSMNGFDWMSYMESAQDKIFIGNVDRDTVEYRAFIQPFLGRFIRVYPIHPLGLKIACMRLEFYGCKKHLGLFCGDPGIPEFGRRVSEGFSVGKSLHFSCIPGFILRGSMTIKCTQDGSWSDQLPICEAIECELTEDNSSMVHINKFKKSKFLFGERLHYSCKNDQQGTGLPYIECRKHGWTKLRFKCQDDQVSSGSGMLGDEENEENEEKDKDSKRDSDLNLAQARLRNHPQKDFFFDKN